MVNDPATQEADEHQIKVLCVDDEPRILDGLENHLAMDYDVHLAEGGQEGLDILASEGPFAVIISDMRMPGMNGATFLKKARELYPETTRMLLTGQSDLDSAVSAVNQGSIFRFLCKPCPPDTLVAAVGDAVRQHNLVLAERQLLETTLMGAVGVLTEVMSLTTPTAFSRAKILASYVEHICAARGITDTWQYGIAAQLSQLGCITLPPDTLAKVYAGQDLTAAESEMFDSHPDVAARLLANIPRLEQVAAMIGLQRCPPPFAEDGDVSTPDEVIAFGAHLLFIARAYDGLIMDGLPRATVMRRVLKVPGIHVALASHLESYKGVASAEAIKALPLNQLRPPMVLDEDVKSGAGHTLVPAGQLVTGPMLERLRNFDRGVGVVQPIRVRISS